MLATAKDLTPKQQELVTVEKVFQSELVKKEELVSTALKELNECAEKSAIHSDCRQQFTKLANLVLEMNLVSSQVTNSAISRALSFCDENPIIASQDSQYHGGPTCP